MSVRITNIQHFLIHDGLWILTILFLKGCSLKYSWVTNQECISQDIEDISGKNISLDDLEHEILKDLSFFYITWGRMTFFGDNQFYNKKIRTRITFSDIKKFICFETSL